MPVNPLDPNLYDPNIVGLYANYRFYTTDLATNEILADIPFKNVSYDRGLKTAGQFSGSIEVLPSVDRGSVFFDLANTEALDLYKTTMPGKTGLYVVRTDGADSQCVWGGIIWSRKYNVISRNLQVSASEFTSYLYHRVAWKTFNHTYLATAFSYGSGICNLQLQGYDEIDPTTGNTPKIKAGSWVKVEFYEVANFRYNGFYRVNGLLSPDGSVISVTIPDLPVATYQNVTVYLRANTIDYVQSLLDSTFVDFIDLRIPNSEIEPERSVDLRVVQTQITDGTARVFVSGDHGMLVGQTGIMKNMDDQDYNGTFIVSSIVGPTGFEYEATGFPNKPVATPFFRQLPIVSRRLKDYIATVTTSAPHNFNVGDEVVISGLDDGQNTIYIFDGTYQIYADAEHPLTATTFSYITAGVYNQAEAAAPAGATATVSPTLSAGTYGSFPYSTDILLDVDGEFEDGSNLDPVRLRGFELRSIGDILDEYSDARNGFEYRIDCEYIPATDLSNEFSGRFMRKLVLLPLTLPNPEYNNGWLTIESFPGATQNIFEYPGNIDQFDIDESAEDAATRFWVAGNIPDLGDDASQPYAGVTAKDLISPSPDVLAQDPFAAWPILDVAESNNDISDENALFELAERYLLESRPPLTKMTVSVNGSIDPKVGTYKPGDWCSILVDDVFVRERIASPLEPDRDFLIRKIESIKVSVPDMPIFPEKVSIELIPEWEVDKRG